MNPFQDLVITLRGVKYQERHRIITGLSENHGKITCLARNSIQSRRFGGSLESFTASEWSWTDKAHTELSTLHEAQTKRSFEGLAKNWDAMALAGTFTEIALRTAPERQPCPELFKLLANALLGLEEIAQQITELSTQKKWILLNAFLAKILQINGVQPSLSACLYCETPLEALATDLEMSGEVAEAGWICAKCRRNGKTTWKAAEDRLGPSQTALFERQLRLTRLSIQDFQMALHLPYRTAIQKASAPESSHRLLGDYLKALLRFHLAGLDLDALQSTQTLFADS